MFDENPTITLSTDMVNFEDVGISVSIPKQELDQGSEMEVFIHPCVTGSFILPGWLGRSRQNFLGYFVAATESPSDKINCDTSPKFIHTLYETST